MVAKVADVIKPIARISLYEQIIAQLKELVVSEQLKPGEKLPSERELAAKLATSRHSLREALRVLTAVGILEIRPGHGTFVSRHADVALNETIFASLVEKDFRYNVLEARKILEPSIAALAALRATNRDLADIENHVRTMEEQVRENQDHLAADLAFHLSLVNATQNLVLIKAIGALENLLIILPPYKAKAARFHRLIFEAVRARDSNAAYRAMEEHLLDLEHDMLSHLRGTDLAERGANRYASPARSDRSDHHGYPKSG